MKTHTRITAHPLTRLTDLPTFKVNMLAALTTKHGEMLYERLLGLRLIECQVLGVVESRQPISLGQLCIELDIDKSLGSRVVVKMVNGGLLERRDDPKDKRAFYLLLTSAGKKMHTKVLNAANKRNEVWMQGLPEQLQTGFMEAVDQHITYTRAMLNEEMRRAKRKPTATPHHEQANPLAVDARPVLVDKAALEDLLQRLTSILK